MMVNLMSCIIALVWFKSNVYERRALLLPTLIAALRIPAAKIWLHRCSAKGDASDRKGPYNPSYTLGPSCFFLQSLLARWSSHLVGDDS